MNPAASNAEPSHLAELAPERGAATRAAKLWVHQLARTIKSCGLYGSMTNTVIERSRLELANELRKLLDQHGPLVLRFTSDDILTEDVSLYPARSRDDNLALPFYRDGIRRMTFSPGVLPAELDVVIDAILQVTGRGQIDDDLVILLWQAQLPHIEVEYVPAEFDLGIDGAMSHGTGVGRGGPQDGGETGDSNGHGSGVGGGGGGFGSGAGHGRGSGSGGSGIGGGSEGSGTGGSGPAGTGGSGSVASGPGGAGGSGSVDSEGGGAGGSGSVDSEGGGAGGSGSVASGRGGAGGGGAIGWDTNIVGPTFNELGTESGWSKGLTFGSVGGDDGGPEGDRSTDTGTPGARRLSSISDVEQGVPWPEWNLPTGAASGSVDEAPPVQDRGPGRSDDWAMVSDAVQAEAVFEELDLVAGPELEAFRERMEAERQTSMATIALEVSRGYLAASDTDADRIEIARLLPRVVRQAAAEGSWRVAHGALTLLEECQSPEWSLDALGEALCQSNVVAAAAASVQKQDLTQVTQLIALARRLGDWAVDFLGRVLVQIDGSEHAGRIIEAIADECRTCPERLAPWLSDTRWNVVRTTVRILNEIGGDGIAPLLETVADHDQAPVRDEVLAALEKVSLAPAQPALIALLDTADTPTFVKIIHRLGKVRHPAVAELLLGYLSHADFERQAVEERRAILAALVTAAGDHALPDLEGKLHLASWFGNDHDEQRAAIAQCIAQIGSHSAKQVLQRGARSRRPAVRKACEDALTKAGKS